MKENKIKFAVRDDDTSFFTDPLELEKAYDFIKEGCISLSVVPFTVPIHKDCVYPYGKEIEYGYYDVLKNESLVNYLTMNVNNRKYEICLHGYSHEYRKETERWFPEMIWKDKERLFSEMKIGKAHLENGFNTHVSVFVAPNNAIDKKGISAVEKLGMNFSGIIQFADRKVSCSYFKNFLLRWGCRAFYKIPYPGILDYGKHKELVAYTLDSVERLKYEYQICKKRNVPFVIYTHYWDLNNNPNTKEILKNIYEYVTCDGATLVPLSECF